MAVSGRDIMVCAQTGSGKTLIFLLPILQKLLERPAPIRKLRGPYQSAGDATENKRYIAQPEALVLVPTRELGLQVKAVAQQLASALQEPLSIELVTGGDKFTPQKQALRRGDCRRLLPQVLAQEPPQVRLVHRGALGLQAVGLRVRLSLCEPRQLARLGAASLEHVKCQCRDHVGC